MIISTIPFGSEGVGYWTMAVKVGSVASGSEGGGGVWVGVEETQWDKSCPMRSPQVQEDFLYWTRPQEKTMDS